MIKRKGCVRKQKEGKDMSVVTTLHDLVMAVSDDCQDAETTAGIIQDIINTGKATTLRSSRRVRVVSSSTRKVSPRRNVRPDRGTGEWNEHCVLRAMGI